MKTRPLLLLSLVLVLLGACRSSRDVAADAPAAAVSAAQFAERIGTNLQTAPTVTARIKMDLNAGGSPISASGTLRMKRDDVVQLSLTFLGMEVGRLEFTPQGVLIIDRVNKQYVEGSYADVGFLRAAGLDFYTLQALFWNELFVPGERSAQGAGGRFRLSTAGQHTLLTLEGAQSLDYAFLVQTRTASIARVDVQSTTGRGGKFAWTYADFAQLDGKPFPTTMTCAVTETGTDVGFTLRLSRLGNDTGWATRTTPPSKYKRRSAAEVLRSLSLQ